MGRPLTCTNTRQAFGRSRPLLAIYCLHVLFPCAPESSIKIFLIPASIIATFTTSPSSLSPLPPSTRIKNRHHYRRFQQEVLHWSSPQSYTRATPSDFAAVISNANSRKNYTSNERHLRVGIRALDGAGARRTLTLSKTDALCLPAGFAYVGHPRICQSGITGPPNSVEAIVEWVGGPPFLRLVPSLRRTNPHQHNSLSSTERTSILLLFGSIEKMFKLQAFPPTGPPDRQQQEPSRPGSDGNKDRHMPDALEGRGGHVGEVLVSQPPIHTDPEQLECHPWCSGDTTSNADVPFGQQYDSVEAEHEMEKSPQIGTRPNVQGSDELQQQSIIDDQRPASVTAPSNLLSSMIAWTRVQEWHGTLPTTETMTVLSIVP
ncbi:predicted protein [Plenodomus lingam JN3]|uniref:Predicted protein n=1 Tax=Leptosphaeria maculans (strain JN3 / isolate v23.1.3 / race Av1-4-5-6-7-8) TaxID=985895 RepID=E4ZME6_LEPMJ|nr:predicted protein [Plenodomus lingam JN3]CBX92495.1 predicted protein [Plenodomus lingam JN3]